jgi:hypothetical protein
MGAVETPPPWSSLILSEWGSETEEEDLASNVYEMPELAGQPEAAPPWGSRSVAFVAKSPRFAIGG